LLAALAELGDLREQEKAVTGVLVGNARYMITPNLDPPFDRPELFASPPLLAVARATLGADVTINSMTVVVALPGALAQRPHVDHAMLFPTDEAASMAAPPTH
jgi:hypothetical protein